MLVPIEEPGVFDKSVDLYDAFYRAAGKDDRAEAAEILRRVAAAGVRPASLLDVVTCLFSSIGYARTTDRLNAAVASMADHLLPGGVLIAARASCVAVEVDESGLSGRGLVVGRWPTSTAARRPQ